MNCSVLAKNLVVGLGATLLACGGTTLDAAQPGDAPQLHAASDTITTGLIPTDLLNLKNKGTSKCVFTPSFKTDSGLALSATTCDSRATLDFVATKQPSGNYTFKNYFSNKCLAVSDGDTENGALVRQVDCDGSTYQQWHTVEITTGVFELRAAHSGKCLDLDYWGNVQQWDCWGGDNQRWRVGLAPNSALTVAYTATDTYHRKCVDTDGSSYTDGGTVMQWDCWGGLNQQWFPVRFADGSYELKPRHSAMCLVIAGAGLDNGTLAEQGTCSGAANQRYTIDAAGSSRYTIHPQHSRKCLERDGASNTANGARIQQWACTGNTNQYFYLPGITTL